MQNGAGSENFLDQKEFFKNNYDYRKSFVETKLTTFTKKKMEKDQDSRKWQPILNQFEIEIIKKNITSKIEFKIASYNLLSPILLNENFYLYENLDQNYLNWKFRRANLLKEIEHINADIYCFQEMDENEYKYFFKRKLSIMGFHSIYKKRSNLKVDGCCIAFRKNIFDLEKKICVDFFMPGIDILNRENVGIILLLKFKPKFSSSLTFEHEPKILCVATTHLLFNPKRGDTKIAQLQLLLANIDRVAHKKSKLMENKLVSEYHPVILCGDFNFSNESKIYEFLIKAKLENFKFLNRSNLSGQKTDFKTFLPIGKNILPECLGVTDQSQFKYEVDSRNLRLLFDKNNLSRKKMIDISFGSDSISHCFHFKSVYSHFDQTGSPEITTCVNDFKKSVDFIFFHSNLSEKSNFEESVRESNKLYLLEKYELFNENDGKNLFIPNEIYSSDHFMIAAKFFLT